MKFEGVKNNKKKTGPVRENGSYYELKRDIYGEIMNGDYRKEVKLKEDEFAKKEKEKEDREYEELTKMTDEEFIKEQKEELVRIEKLRQEKGALTIKDITGKFPKGESEDLENLGV